MKKLIIALIPFLILCLFSCEKENVTETKVPETKAKTGEREQVGASEYKGVEFILYSDNTAIIYNIKTESDINYYDALNLPTVIDGCTVTEIEDGVFEALPYREIKLPEKLEKIGERAFRKTLIEKITIPASVKEIGKEAFDNCTSLTECVFNADTGKINVGTFYNCKNLESVTLSDSVKEICDDAFCDCISLSKLKLPAKLEKIGAYSFAGCKALENVSIPESVSEIGERCFEETGFYNKCTEDFAVFGDGVLIKCNIDSEKINVPENVKYISTAFGEKVKEITVPQSVKFCENAVSSGVKIIYK